MNKREIAPKLYNSTYIVTSFYGQEPFNPETTIGLGSGVAFTENGYLLTATHVITGRNPAQEEDIQDPDIIILAKRKSGKLQQYRPYIFTPPFNNPHLKNPIAVDLTVLSPINPQKNVPYLPISLDAVELGIPVLMAGFPDDMELPFNLDVEIDEKQQGNQDLKKQFIFLRNQLLMIKSGMVGFVNGFVLTDGNLRLEGEFLYVDNELHSGASGGPVVNENAEIIGIITKRAMTSNSSSETPNLKVPSGSTLAISPRTIKELLNGKALLD